MIAVHASAVDDVGGVEPAPEADLEHRDLDAGPTEQLEGDGRRHLEEGRLGRERAVREQAVDRVAHVATAAASVAFGHGPAVDDEPFGEVDQVGRRVARDLCPAARSAASTMAVTDPLPLVPAM